MTCFRVYRWNSTDVDIRRSEKLPSGHENWTLHVGDAKKDLSADDVTTDSSTATRTDLYAWDDFFSGSTAPAREYKATVCLTRGGAACVVSRHDAERAGPCTSMQKRNSATFNRTFEADIWRIGDFGDQAVSRRSR